MVLSCSIALIAIAHFSFALANSVDPIKALAESLCRRNNIEEYAATVEISRAAYQELIRPLNEFTAWENHYINGILGDDFEYTKDNCLRGLRTSMTEIFENWKGRVHRHRGSPLSAEYEVALTYGRISYAQELLSELDPAFQEPIEALINILLVKAMRKTTPGIDMKRVINLEKKAQDSLRLSIHCARCRAGSLEVMATLRKPLQELKATMIYASFYDDYKQAIDYLEQIV